MINRISGYQYVHTIVFTLILFIGCSSSDVTEDRESKQDNEATEQAENSSENNEGSDLSVAEFISQMGVGWNLGNSFDVESRDKTFWGNPLPTKEMIDLVAASGFKTLRIPVTWGFHQNDQAPFTIESDFLRQVQEVVDFGIANKMYVIIDVHHDDDWIQLVAEESDYVKERLASLWRQVAIHFKDYDQQLVFDVLNEPRLKGTSLEWSGGDNASRLLLNEYHKVGVDAIRMSGGENTSRFLMIATYAASTLEGPMNDLVIPNNDPNVIVSLHTYFPWSFAGDENGPDTWGSAQEKLALDGEMDRIYQKWVVQEGRSVVLGEWGTRNKNNLSERIEYTSYYVEAALKRGLIPVVWDDGGNFGLQDRNAINWEFPEIIDAIFEAVDNTTMQKD
ncbi:MAG: glycoside hydrolase family 5 protein [Allomuricauda sp.]|nr:MAG: glycoside hydrolase family 5 protein [Allomuricauda sp.]